MKECVKPTDTLRLIIAGDGPQMNYLKNLALEYGIMSQVTFTGELSQEELNTCFAVCDVFVSATGSMTMKASPLEAIACGVLTVIIPKKSANADIVIEGQNGFTYENPTRYVPIDAQFYKYEQPTKSLFACVGQRNSRTFNTCQSGRNYS